MSSSFVMRLVRRVLPALLVSALPALAMAQGGRITGVVKDAEQKPLAGATVSVSSLGLGAQADAEGKYTIRNVPAGTYRVTAQRLGSKPAAKEGVAVVSGQDVTVDFTLEGSSVVLGGVVVSASRRIEKLTEAPASVTRIDASAIENTIGNSFAPALKAVPGLDFVQVGMTAVAVNARGFNSSFNNRMLMMEDNRIAVLPENGLRSAASRPFPRSTSPAWKCSSVPALRSTAPTRRTV